MLATHNVQIEGGAAVRTSQSNAELGGTGESMARTEIDIEEIELLTKRIDEINSIRFSDIVWRKNGVGLDIPKKTVEEWGFVGMSNVAFIQYRVYENEVTFNVGVQPPVLRSAGTTGYLR
jgi:hypothetical protein